jgi:hypothetical protein
MTYKNALAIVKARTQEVIGCLAFNSPLNIPATVDYGVTSARHYRALREAISYYEQAGDTEANVYRECRQRYLTFEKARCQGKAITAFVRKYALAYADVVFQTSWDEINEFIKR